MTGKICPVRSGPLLVRWHDDGFECWRTEIVDAPCVKEKCQAWNGGRCLMMRIPEQV